MTEDELEELLRDCPILYHIAERGSWLSIKRHGLLSTNALLKLFEVGGKQRRIVDSMHRATSVRIDHPLRGVAVIRDQRPMTDRALRRCLQGGLTPSDWYRHLNKRVFFWLSRKRLTGMLSAAAYAQRSHDVIEIDAVKIIKDYRNKIALCHINSGSTQRQAHPRGLRTFQTIEDYPYNRRRRRDERVIELSIFGGVTDISKYVRRVIVMKKNVEQREIWRPKKARR